MATASALCPEIEADRGAVRRPPEIGILVSPCALAAAAVRRWRAAAGAGAAAEEPKIWSGNVFVALETLKKKKKKPAAADKAAAKPAAARDKEEGPKPEVFWAPAPLTAKSWADVDDDDDYFATTAPPPMPVWGDAHRSDAAEDQHAAPALEEELKKKELAELDAVLAELGLGTSNNSTQDESNGKKGADQVADGEKKDDAPAPLESKNSKKKKSKKERQERIKKVAFMKKKKSSKEMDAAAKIAASEAAARSARLATAKKKEKSHYNQQPVR
ncbi:unnamed protein product [Miscanthus lutarioriparius]|uniref:Uncharacterized protein n=1 Tax=Miscanthus lutarioriparius TaxID=422564 RepID=A0A811SPE0_9POAL|nr:unnamed protein product [Miscanthus lutarioriparius]